MWITPFIKGFPTAIKMGLEANTILRKGKTEAKGRLHLDSKQLVFSSKTLKWSVDLGPDVKASTRGTQLVVSWARDKAVFEIGDEGEKWVEKILNPPSRLDKLGVKPGMACWLSNGFGQGFKRELKDRKAKITRQIGRCDLAFFFVAHRDRLGDLFEVCESLGTKTNIWVVYPKGHDAISQSDVRNSMKKIGFGPGKTAAFDDGVSSMRYARKK